MCHHQPSACFKSVPLIHPLSYIEPIDFLSYLIMERIAGGLFGKRKYLLDDWAPFQLLREVLNFP